jgi:hypothetical protein
MADIAQAIKMPAAAMVGEGYRVRASRGAARQF